MRFRSLICVMLLFCSSSYADTDSLRLLLNQASKDSTTVLKIIRIAQKNTGNNPEEALNALQLALSAAKKINFPTGIAKAHVAIGFAFRSLSQFDSTQAHYSIAIDLLIKLNRQKDLIMAYYNNMGMVEKEKGNFTRAIDYYIRSLNIAGKLHDNRGQGRAFSNMGIVYRNMKNLDKSTAWAKRRIRWGRPLQISVMFISTSRILNKQ